MVFTGPRLSPCYHMLHGSENEQLGGHLHRLACLEAQEPGQQSAIRGFHFPGPLRYGGIRMGHVPPGTRERGAVSGPVLGVGAVRHRAHLRDGRVQDEPPAETEGAGAPLHPPLPRLAPHRNPSSEHVPVLRFVMTDGSLLGPRGETCRRDGGISTSTGGATTLRPLTPRSRKAR